MAATLTTVTTSTGGISAVYDYSSYLERIASSLETITQLITPTPTREKLGAGVLSVELNVPVTTLSTTTSIRTVVSSPEIYNGTTATFSATLVTEYNGSSWVRSVTDVVIINSGSGYLQPPTYTILEEESVLFTTSTTALEFSPNLFTAIARISNVVDDLKTISTSTGFRTYNAYDWVKPLEMISWYGQEYGISSYSTTGTQTLISIINSLTNQVSKFE
jgi:hypothetical protein